jgi:ATP-dependent phosphofructokinase / diphosphate-dependent phosphofructokinase
MLKGNLAIGQSGGPTPVINASLAGVILESMDHPEIKSIYGLVHGIEGALKEEFIDLSQLSSQTLQLLVSTPASALGSCRHKVNDREYERILNVFQAHNIRYFVYIGGNDSMDTCLHIQRLASALGYEIQIMGVPKTIDNDLAHTDHSPGYGSAARFIALATRDTGLDLEAMATFDAVTILETMGRNAGWLTAASGISKEDEADAPHLIYVPEVPFDEMRFLDDVSDVHKRYHRVFVVVCEGIRDHNQEYIGQIQKSDVQDAFGHSLPTLTTGVASFLSMQVKEKLKLRSRFLRPVLIGRSFSACVSQIDRNEALEVGREAVKQLANGRSGYMVTLDRISNEPYKSCPGFVELSSVANSEKLLPLDYLSDSRTMISSSFKEYVKPLIGEPLAAITRLKNIRIEKKLG